MATKTLILRPTAVHATTAANWDATPAVDNKADYWRHVSEETPDEDATYISTAISLPYNGFLFTFPEHILPTAIRIVARMRTTVAGAVAYVYYRLSSSDNVKELESVALTTQYETYSLGISAEDVLSFWEACKLQASLETPTAYAVAFTTNGAADKTSYDLRLTQLYLEVDYEDVLPLLYLRTAGTYEPIYGTSVYKKIDGIWQANPQDLSFTSNKIQWKHPYLTFTELGNNTYSVRATDISKLPSVINIPKTFKGKPITAIEEQAFYGAALTKVVIPDSVLTVGAQAFYGCTSLSSVRLSSSLSCIDTRAFYGCKMLKTLYIPAGITAIGSYAFTQSGLTSITIPDGIVSIGDYAFSGCTDLLTAELPGSLSIVSASLFDCCYSLAKVTLHNGITKIQYLAFYSCGSLKEIIIPDSVTIIESFAFSHCYNITIYCEAQSIPVSFEIYWNYLEEDYPANVVLGYTG